MGFIKVVKNKAYFKRFQVKFKRRRQCKTDYYARRRLIIQDKNKYQTPKYRFVVRFSNKDITCQIFSADMTHDICLAAAYSHELRRYGITLGLTNYSAAYATGLLLARRVNSKLGLDYAGQEEVDGEYFKVEGDPEGKGPFKAYLDVGLARTTTGVKIFGALKGACDGGLDIPHNNRRFPGTTKSGSDYNADPEVMKKYIFGGHIAEYMEALEEDDEKMFQKQFRRFIDAGIGADDLEGLYQEAHAGIRKDPFKKRADTEFGSFKTRDSKPKEEDIVKKHWNMRKKSVQERMGRVKQKLLAKGIKSLAA
jgi:large subunit ribosomal protein L5e